jgi:hypothetical protein
MSTEFPQSSGKRNWQEELSATGDELVGRVKEMVKEGNVRRIIIKHEDRTLLEVPLTIGVVGAILAPQIAAVGALAALVSRCAVTIEREEDDNTPTSGAGGPASLTGDTGAGSSGTSDPSI